MTRYRRTSAFLLAFLAVMAGRPALAAVTSLPAPRLDLTGLFELVIADLLWAWGGLASLGSAIGPMLVVGAASYGVLWSMRWRGGAEASAGAG